MKKKTRIIAIILCIVTVVSMIAPLVVNAEPTDTQTETTEVVEETTTPEDIAPDNEATSEDMVAPDESEPIVGEMPEETETPEYAEDIKKEEETVTPPTVADDAVTTGPSVETETEDSDTKWDGLCTVKVKLDAEVTEKTDNIVIQFIPAKSITPAGKVTLTRAQDFTADVRLQPGDYKISFVTADNQYEVILKENRVEVPEAKGAELTVNAKKIQDGSFLASFFRDNSLLLVLLAGCSIALGVIKYRKAHGYN